MGHVFVSYCHEDRPHVEALVSSLRDSNVSVWWDDDLRPGEPWERQIDSALQGASSIVVVWTEKSLQSSEVGAEAEFALSTRKAVPVRMQDVRLTYRWAPLQRVDLFTRPPNANADWSDLVKALRNRQGKNVDAASAPTLPVLVDDDGIVIPTHLVAPAVLVLLTVISALAVAAMGIEAVWAPLVPGALGAAAIGAAFASFAPRRAAL